MLLPSNPFNLPVACLVFLAAVAAPYRVDYHAAYFSVSSASAIAQGNGGGNGNGGDNGPGGGTGGGNGTGNGNGNGGGNGAGYGNANGGGNGNGRGVEKGGATSRGLRGADLVVRHPDGITEKIENGRYEMLDASGRTIINRGATRADRSRLGR
jgi:hypothetical protein